MFGRDPLTVLPGSKLRAVLGQSELMGDYFCNYGMNAAYEARFEAAGLRVSARGADGEIRAMELDHHPFYLITLFQPQLASTVDSPHPIVTAFLRASAAFQAERRIGKAEPE